MAFLAWRRGVIALIVVFSVECEARAVGGVAFRLLIEESLAMPDVCCDEPRDETVALVVLVCVRAPTVVEAADVWCLLPGD